MTTLEAPGLSQTIPSPQARWEMQPPLEDFARDSVPITAPHRTQMRRSVAPVGFVGEPALNLVGSWADFAPKPGLERNTDSLTTLLQLERVRDLAGLPDGWDSYGASAPGPEVIEIGCEVVRTVNADSKLKPLCRFITATGQSGIALRYQFGDRALTWEIDYDGEIGLMLQRADRPSVFWGVERARLNQAFAAALAENG